jgi:hypothetical protein
MNASFLLNYAGVFLLCRSPISIFIVQEKTVYVCLNLIITGYLSLLWTIENTRFYYMQSVLFDMAFTYFKLCELVFWCSEI